MSYSDDDIDLAEQVMRLTARVAELEERLSRLEGGGSVRAGASSAGGTTASAAASPVAGEELLAGIKAVLERFGEADTSEIRQELIKTGFPAALTRSDLNKVLYRHTDLFTKESADASKPQWRLI